MIKNLFWLDLRQNKWIIIAFTAIFLMYGSVSVGMFDPEGADTLQAMLDMLPDSLVRMMGFDNLGGSITSYISNYLYGFIMVIFPMIFAIIIGTRLVVKHVDSGSMTYLVTMPYTRRQIVITQAVFFALSLFTIIAINVIVIIIMAESMFPDMLDIWAFVKLNLVTYAVHLAMAALAFLFSVLFSDASTCTGVSGGLLVTFFILNMISTISEKTEFVKYFTPFSMINIDSVLSGKWILLFLAPLVAAIVVFVGSIEIFHRKSLII